MDDKLPRVGPLPGLWFEPCEDITAYELAQILDVFLHGIVGMAAHDFFELFDTLPEQVKRHFVDKRF